VGRHSKSKGGSFEREFCRDLSAWWSGGERDDLFWRTSTSGGRATVRAKQNKETYGMAGDVAATHPDASPFTEVLVVELKKGYNRDTVTQLLEVTETSVLKQYEEWIWKLHHEMLQHNRKGWLLVHKRDQHPAIAWMNKRLLVELGKKSVAGSWNTYLAEFGTTVQLRVTIREVKPKPKPKKGLMAGKGRLTMEIVGMGMDEFFYNIGPEEIKELVG